MLRDHYNDFLEVFRTRPTEEITPVFYDAKIRLLVTPSQFLHEYCEAEFDESIRVESQATRNEYANQLVNFLNYLSVRKIRLEDIEYKTLKNYRDDQKDGSYAFNGEPISPSTINSRIDRASGFCDWLHAKGVLQKKATKYTLSRKTKSGIRSDSGDSIYVKTNKLHLPTERREISMQLPTRDQLNETCERLKEKGLMAPHQEIAIKLAFRCGLRIHECSGLEHEEFLSAKPMSEKRALYKMRIGTTKGSKPRFVHLPRTLFDLMRSYDASISRPPSSSLFLVNPRARKKDKAFTEDALGDYFQDYFMPELRLVVGNPNLELTYHGLRHTYAGDLLLEQLGFERPLNASDAQLLRARLGGVAPTGAGDMRTGISISPIETALTEVQDRLGHKFRASTDIYVRWAQEMIKATLATGL